MNKSEQIAYLNNILLQEMPQYQLQADSFSNDEQEQRNLLRSLMNVRPPMPLNASFLKIQDELLSSETKEKGIVKASSLSSIAPDSKIILWRGDITRLEVDAIVDADNAALLGCFYPCHSCIDNAIHSAAGLQLRDECNHIMEEQGFPEPTGKAKITKAYNLPSKYIIHTVGPIVEKELTKQNCDELASCYRSCLELANEHHLSSIAFCCISTGEYHFPNEQAAEIAIDTVQNNLQNNPQIKQVIFNVFTEKDESIYRRLLHED